ncbi:MAG: hypothetical protein DHS20C18_09110 [Saprospiraceae bacterium]|nr:MAG: hypothetical protein DHS20C18_09110 [Saprospiraceae bacterium]
MKVLLFIPENYYGFFHTIKDTFTSIGGEVHSINYRSIVKGWEEKINTQIYRLPDKYRRKWENHYFKRINEHYIAEYNRIQPDVIFVYNNELLMPETVQYFKKKSKVVFFLGDCPYYTPTNRHFLPILFHADAIFTTDTFWISALKKLGITQGYHMYPSFPKQHFRKQLSPDQYEALKSEVLYVGMCYKTSWGLKKANFLNAFTGFDLHIHGGDSWKRWFDHYPDLKEYYKERDGYISVEKLNDMYNATKVAPIDANPGLLHAVHWRMLEALGSGALPLMEWQQGVEEIFGGINDIPAVKVFEEAREMTRFYLDHEDKRLAMVEQMTNRINKNHSMEKNAAMIQQTLNI